MYLFDIDGCRIDSFVLVFIMPSSVENRDLNMATNSRGQYTRCNRRGASRCARNVSAWTNVGRADVGIGPYHGLCVEHLGPLREGAVSEADWGSMRDHTAANSLRLRLRRIHLPQGGRLGLCDPARFPQTKKTAIRRSFFSYPNSITTVPSRAASAGSRW